MESASAEAPQPKRMIHRTRDGSTYVYDPEAKAWRFQSAPASEPQAATAAIAWSQFNVSFDGDFTVAGRPLRLGEARVRPDAEQVHGDTGRSVWDGAVALAKVLERSPSLVAGKSLLELGAGRGVSGLASTLLGARKVVLTDLAYCLESLQEVVDLNRPAVADVAATSESGTGSCLDEAVQVAELDWLRPEDFLSGRGDGEEFDVILAADVVWLMELVEPLAYALTTLGKRFPKATVLVMHQTRASNVEKAFLDAMARSFELQWELRGGAKKSSTAELARGSPPDEIAWHADFTPDERVQLWCFQSRDKDT